MTILNMDDFSLILLDLVQNSIAANAKNIDIHMDIQPSMNRLTFMIKDDGHGMNENVLMHVTDPFYTTRKTRKVGLGLAFLKQLTEMTEGTFQITSKENQGTTITSTFRYNHIDLPPLGDLADTLYLLIAHQTQFDLTYHHAYDAQSVIINKRDLLNLLDGLKVTDYKVQKAIKAYINETIQELKGETQ